VAFTADCENPNPPPDTIAAPEKPPSGRACGLQNLHYTYDPAGNITHIRDDAQQTVYFRNQRVEPSNDYFYDALYRLIQADGREHLGQMASGERLPPTAPDAFNAFQMSQDQPNVLKAMGAYTERYVYDAVGNFLQMQHRGTDPAHAGWARTFVYAEDSLTEAGKWSNRLSSTTLNPAGNTPQPEAYVHDAQGSMLRMPHLARMDWDYRDRLLATSRHVANDEPPPDKLQQTTYYVYDASGQRVRKVCEKAPGLTEERIYLGGFEMFRKHGGAIGANTARLERETLHAMDNKQRIALVETCTLGDEPHVPRRLIRYQFGNHIGSASLELDDQAQIISYEEYSPYGSSTYQAMSSQTETPKRYRYTGKERDEESGLYYHEARYYAANLGRWTSSDPNGVRGGIDMYVYAASRPVVLVDPQGTQPCTASPLVCDPKDYKEPKSEATGRLMLNTLSKGIENFDPIAQATAQVLAGRIWERQSGANGSYYYAYSKSKVEALGKSIGLTAEESSELAAMVRSFAPSDNRLQMDYAGRVGTRASLASREASEKLEIVLNPGSGIGGILAGFVGMAGGTAADMRAVAQAGGMLEAAGMAKKGAASDAINASTPRNVGIDQSTARTSAARGGSGSGDGGRAELPASDPGQASRLRAELAAKHLANADRRGVGKDVIKNPMVPGSGLKADAQHRMASFLTENEMASATVTPIKGADGIPRTLVQVPNYSFEGKLGIVEYVIDKDGAVTHQRFIEGGVIGAGPNNRTAHGM
jgi:RHS repeat-associated protein